MKTVVSILLLAITLCAHGQTMHVSPAVDTARLGANTTFTASGIPDGYNPANVYTLVLMFLQDGSVELIANNGGGASNGTVGAVPTVWAQSRSQPFRLEAVLFGVVGDQKFMTFWHQQSAPVGEPEKPLGEGEYDPEGGSTAGTSTAGTSTAGTSTAGTSTAGTSTAGTSTGGTSTAGTSTGGGTGGSPPAGTGDPDLTGGTEAEGLFTARLVLPSRARDTQWTIRLLGTDGSEIAVRQITAPANEPYVLNLTADRPFTASAIEWVVEPDTGGISFEPSVSVSSNGGVATPGGTGGYTGPTIKPQPQPETPITHAPGATPNDRDPNVTSKVKLDEGQLADLVGGLSDIKGAVNANADYSREDSGSLKAAVDGLRNDSGERISTNSTAGNQTWMSSVSGSLTSLSNSLNSLQGKLNLGVSSVTAHSLVFDVPLPLNETAHIDLNPHRWALTAFRTMGLAALAVWFVFTLIRLVRGAFA